MNARTAEEQASIDSFFGAMRKQRDDRRAAALQASDSLSRLVDVCEGRTGQSFKIRSLLYSLWNGQSTRLSDVMSLDWSIRVDMCAVILGFGYEDADVQFFYDAVASAFRQRGLFDWFIAEREEKR